MPTTAGLPEPASEGDGNDWAEGTCFYCGYKLQVLYVGTIHVPGMAAQAFACEGCIRVLVDMVLEGAMTKDRGWRRLAA
ncbi:hypothetical protein [Streptomyces armeniacus]|nr:hypothetical protein [Streptomyces armeniacus]